MRAFIQKFCKNKTMKKNFEKLIQGYKTFRKQYADGDHSAMAELASGQHPETMVIACSDSRVDPALLLQCDPGDIFTVRNVANIVPPYEADEKHHGTSAALEFGICYLNVKSLIILGHSQCGGIEALLQPEQLEQNDFIGRWVSVIKPTEKTPSSLSKAALLQSYENCLTFPWIKERLENKTLGIHLWFFDIKSGEISNYHFDNKTYLPLSD